MPFFAAAITFAAMESSSVRFCRSTALPELLLFLFAFSKIFGTAPASLLLSLASLSFCRLVSATLSAFFGSAGFPLPLCDLGSLMPPSGLVKATLFGRPNG